MPSYSDSEIPLGLINGVNKTFQLSNAPNPPLCLIVNSDSSLLSPFDVNGFTLLGNSLVLVKAPVNTLIVWYRF
jgi:hypothetical protein